MCLLSFSEARRFKLPRDHLGWMWVSARDKTHESVTWLKDIRTAVQSQSSADALTVFGLLHLFLPPGHPSSTHQFSVGSLCQSAVVPVVRSDTSWSPLLAPSLLSCGFRRPVNNIWRKDARDVIRWKLHWFYYNVSVIPKSNESRF